MRTTAWIMALGVLAACGSGRDDASTPAATATIAEVQIPGTDERGVAVRVIGVLDAGGTLCPAAQPGCPTGITVEGAPGQTIEPGTVDATGPLTGAGWYDGHRLLLAGPLSVGDVELEPEPSFDSLCPELSNAAGSAGEGAVTAALELLGSADPAGAGSDALALSWFDPATNVFTFWFARDLERHEDAIRQAFRPAAVCLASGATFSERELRTAGQQVRALLDQGLFEVQGGFNEGGGRANRIVLPIEALDPDGRAALDALAPVEPVPFVELLDRPLSALPTWQPAQPGNVELLTAPARSTVGLAALGTFTLGYDEAGGCVYGDSGDGVRTAIMWPYGYSAERDDTSVTIQDPSGAVRATVGETISLGGGYTAWDAPASTVPTWCGATRLWVVAPA